ncbi:MAG: hypothetical protein Q8R00_01445 [Candidatus Nanoarchaeia archaeon]|nr:hypothetical protein [Candidatus Nanoarchaeia archaeon]
MKPITDNSGNKMYGYSLYDLEKMVHLQQLQIKSLNKLIRWKQIQVAITTMSMAVFIYLLVWIDYHDIFSRLITGG